MRLKLSNAPSKEGSKYYMCHICAKGCLDLKIYQLLTKYEIFTNCPNFLIFTHKKMLNLLFHFCRLRADKQGNYEKSIGFGRCLEKSSVSSIDMMQVNGDERQNQTCKKTSLCAAYKVCGTVTSFLTLLIEGGLGGGHSNIRVVHMCNQMFSKHILIEICPFQEKHPLNKVFT